MHKTARKLLAFKFGSKTGKLKKKHIVRAKFFVRGKQSITKLNADEINTLLADLLET